MVIIDPILGELEGATLHWLMLRLIVPANAQHPQQRTMYDREEINKTLHTSPIHAKYEYNSQQQQPYEQEQ